MNKMLLATAAAISAFSMSAMAADQPYKQSVAAPASWSGFYAGLNGGYGWGNAQGCSTLSTDGHCQY